MKRLSLGAILIVIIFMISGCTKYGIFSETGNTDIETKDGYKITETTDMETCTKTVITELKDGTKVQREFPIDPELCQKAKKEKE